MPPPTTRQQATAAPAWWCCGPTVLILLLPQCTERSGAGALRQGHRSSCGGRGVGAEQLLPCVCASVSRTDQTGVSASIWVDLSGSSCTGGAAEVYRCARAPAAQGSLQGWWALVHVLHRSWCASASWRLGSGAHAEHQNGLHAWRPSNASCPVVATAWVQQLNRFA